MNIVLTIILVALFGYSLALVLANNSVVGVNLLFANPPAMNLGLLLIVSLVLGVLIGGLLALIAFKVLPMRFELGRLRKDKQALQTKLDEANIVIQQHRGSQVLKDTHPVVLNEAHRDV